MTIARMPLPGPSRRIAVHDRDDVGEALARARAGRQDVVRAGRGDPDRVLLVPVQAERDAAGATAGALGLVAPEDRAVRVVEDALGSQLVDRGARRERGVELDQRLGPEQALAELAVDDLVDAGVADVDEAARELLVVGDQSVAEREDVHWVTPLSGRDSIVAG